MAYRETILLLCSAMLLMPLALARVEAGEVIDIGSRLELFADDFLIEKLTGARQVLHHPTPKEVVMVHDQPWEGSGCGYHTVFQDGDLYRMYYKAWQLTVSDKKLVQPHPCFGAYAESTDGVHWKRPTLGLFQFAGSKKNNLVWVGPGGHDFTPFRDTNPACKPEALYKAVACGKGGLVAFQSPDGIRWKPMNGFKPVMTEGAFDTQNLAFWDAVRGEYRAYIRDFRSGKRDIRTATSKDFIQWTTPAWLKYPGAPREQLYTNQIKPYHRAPHIFIGFPARYLDRGWSESMKALSDLEHRELRARASRRYGTALTDSLLMTSRDGLTFHRWREAFLRPGLRLRDNWKYGDNYIAWHLVETRSHIADAPNELSLYATEGYWTGQSSQLRRFTLRIDGFVSVQAPATGGELLTKPLRFEGSRLVINFSTSVAGSVRVEVQGADGKPIKGFALADCPEIFGDALDRAVSWKGGADAGKLAGKPVRLRFAMKDADLFSIRFR